MEEGSSSRHWNTSALLTSLLKYKLKKHCIPRKSEISPTIKTVKEAGMIILTTGSFTSSVVLGPWKIRVMKVSLIKWWLHWRCSLLPSKSTKPLVLDMKLLIWKIYPPLPHSNNWIWKSWLLLCRDSSLPSRSTGIGSVSMTPRYHHCCHSVS